MSYGRYYNKDIFGLTRYGRTISWAGTWKTTMEEMIPPIPINSAQCQGGYQEWFGVCGRHATSCTHDTHNSTMLASEQCSTTTRQVTQTNPVKRLITIVNGQITFHTAEWLGRGIRQVSGDRQSTDIPLADWDLP